MAIGGNCGGREERQACGSLDNSKVFHVPLKTNKK